MKKNENENGECPRCHGEGFYWVDTTREEPGYAYPLPSVRKEICPECARLKRAGRHHPHSGMTEDEKKRTFDASEMDGQAGRVLTAAMRFVAEIDERIAAGDWLYIHADQSHLQKPLDSAYGTGKTHTLCCMANALAGQRPALYVTESALYSEIRSTYGKESDESELEVLNKYTSVPVLFIDDLFKSKMTDWVEDKLFQILDRRNTTGRVTVISSNVAPERIPDVMPTNGGAVVSRILGRAKLVELIGRDRRRHPKNG